MDIYEKLRSLNFLIVDDDEWVRDSLQLFFRSEGCKTTALETAEEGLDYTACNYFDIIFVDYRLPGMNGLEFIKRLPGNYVDALKVLFTAYGSQKLKIRAKQSGVDEFIAKPFTIEIIEGSLKRMFTSQKK